jgi:hypothetical protein
MSALCCRLRRSRMRQVSQGPNDPDRLNHDTTRPPTRRGKSVQFCALRSPRRARARAKSRARKSRFPEAIQADWGCPVPTPKNRFPKTRNCGAFHTSRSHKGRWPIVTNVGRDAVDAAARRAELVAGQVFACERSRSRKTSGAGCGRQSRVVLAPVAGVKSAEVREPDRACKTLIRWRR